jgi:hypothetical protein
MKTFFGWLVLAGLVALVASNPGGAMVFAITVLVVAIPLGLAGKLLQAVLFFLKPGSR